MKGISEFCISKGLAGATAASGQGDSSDEVRLFLKPLITATEY